MKILTVENITDKELILDFNTNMPDELGIYTLQDNSSSEYGDLGVGDVCSLSSEASEEEIHENRKRCVAYLITWLVFRFRGAKMIKGFCFVDLMS